MKYRWLGHFIVDSKFDSELVYSYHVCQFGYNLDLISTLRSKILETNFEKLGLWYQYSEIMTLGTYGQWANFQTNHLGEQHINKLVSSCNDNSFNSLRPSDAYMRR